MIDASVKVVTSETEISTEPVNVGRMSWNEIYESTRQYEREREERDRERRQKQRVHTSYLRKVFDPEIFQTIAARTVLACETFPTPFDVIAFTGQSGAALAHLVGWALNKPLICVRKPGDGSHFINSGHGSCEGFMDFDRYLFLDDQISSGATFRRVQSLLSTVNSYARCAGVVLYSQNPWGDIEFVDRGVVHRVLGWDVSPEHW